MNNIESNAVETYGSIGQLIVAIEEMSELTKELTKFLRGNTGNVNREHIAEEMADVYIMLEQLLIIFDNKADVCEWKDIKIKGLKKE